MCLRNAGARGAGQPRGGFYVHSQETIAPASAGGNAGRAVRTVSARAIRWRNRRTDGSAAVFRADFSRREFRVEGYAAGYFDRGIRTPGDGRSADRNAYERAGQG